MDRVGKVPVITNSGRQELLMDEPNSGIQFNGKKKEYLYSFKVFPYKICLTSMRKIVMLQ